MKQLRTGVGVVLALLLLSVTALKAEVKTEEKTLMKFEGMLGKMMGMFGGKAMKDGMTNSVAVKGNRKASFNTESGEIIDLDQQVVYRINMKKKNYEVITFAELRRQMEETEKEAAEAMKRQSPENPPPDQAQMQIDLDLKESGQKRQINGYDCREVVMIVTMHEKGKTLEQAGGMVMTSNIWLAPEIPFLQEIRDFDARYAQALAGPLALGAADAQQMAAAMGMYPGMKDMIGKVNAEKVNMKGTEILTQVTMESVRGAQQAQQKSEEADAAPQSVGGIGGLLGRKLLKKKANEPASGASNRATIFTTQHELLKAAPEAIDSDVAIPAGFKQSK
jgi:hypothetical protein